MATKPAPAPDISLPIPTDPKSGLFTTEGWVALLTLLLPAATLVFHQDFSSQVQAIAAAAAGLTAAAYTISRALTKSAQVKASAAAVTTVAAAQAGTTNSAAPGKNGQVLVNAAAADVEEIQAAAEQLAALLRDAERNDAPAAQNGNRDKPIIAVLG